MIPVIINLSDYTAGDTWYGLKIGPILFNDLQPVASLSSCRLYFRLRNNGRIGYKFSSSPSLGEGTIDITDPVTWEVTINQQILPLYANIWSWDFETTDSNGVVRTLYTGKLNVNQDVTHD